MAMVSVASAAFFFISPVSDAYSVKPGGNVGGLSTRAHIHGIRQERVSFKILQAGNVVMDGLKSDDKISCSPSPRAFIKQLPDWKAKRPDMLGDPFGLGQIVHDGLIFRQNFSIRSYEIGADRTVSMETLMNHLQETGLNHLKHVGLLGDGLGSTPEMCKRNLIWVVTKMQVMVDRYPTWGDVVQVDTWIAASGKNCVRRDWVIRDHGTGDILTKASSCYVTMNKQTRKLSKLPDEVRTELGTFFVDALHSVDEDKRKLQKLTDSNACYIQPGLMPCWSDLDVNQHVNNAKYVGWILQSVPQPVVESHELASMTLEYKKECKWDNVLDSLTCVLPEGTTDGLANCDQVECQHLLRLKAGADIMKGRTKWRPKRVKDKLN